MKVLIVVDDRAESDYLANALREVGYVVDQVEDGLVALTRASHSPYDALVVDRMLPSLDGLSMIEALRKAGKQAPVLIVSALGDVDERVRGLRCGGDDYLVKPYAFAELLARLENIVTRRSSDAPQTRLVVGNLEMDLLSRTVRRGGAEILLQSRELKMLEFLMRRAGQVVTRTMLLASVWDYHFDPQTNVIDVHISRLRKKIGKDPPLIHTMRGAGYMLRA